MVWQALDQFGNVSEAYIRAGTMRSDEHLRECLEKRLIPFIEKYNKDSEILFWPDLATIHYSRDVQNWLRSKNIDFVPKTRNAPTVPIARPIEKFWDLCKVRYSRRQNMPKSLTSLRKVWQTISEEVAETNGQSLMRGMRQKLRLIGRERVLAPYKH